MQSGVEGANVQRKNLGEEAGWAGAGCTRERVGAFGVDNRGGNLGGAGGVEKSRYGSRLQEAGLALISLIRDEPERLILG